MELIVRIVLLAGVLFISNRIQSSFGSIHMSLWNGDGGAGTVDQMAGSATSKASRGMGLGKRVLLGGAGAYLLNRAANKRSKNQTAAITNALGSGGQQGGGGHSAPPSTAASVPSFKSRVMGGIRSLPKGVSTLGGKFNSAWKNHRARALENRINDRTIAQKRYDKSDGKRSVQSLARSVAFDRRKRAALNAKNKAMYGIASFKDRTLKKFDDSKFARAAGKIRARGETFEKYELKRQERRENGQTYFSSKAYKANRDAAYANGERFASVKGAFKTAKDEFTERHSIRKSITDGKFGAMRKEMSQYRKEHSAQFDSSYTAPYNEVNTKAQQEVMKVREKKRGRTGIGSGNWRGSPRELRRQERKTRREEAKQEKARNRRGMPEIQEYMGGE